MGMPELVQRWTREMVLALPDDGNRYELLDGELLVSPSPRSTHQDTVGALFVPVLPTSGTTGSATPRSPPPTSS